MPSLIIRTIVLLTGFLIVRCSPPVQAPVVFNIEGKRFADTNSCKSCHLETHESYVNMAHYSSSASTDHHALYEVMKTADSVLILSDSLKYIMTLKNGELVQQGWAEDSLIKEIPFHVTIGSGKRGQTFLHWEKDYLFQLPVSTYAQDSIWVNSPGYSSERLRFNRTIKPECLACHATYATNIEDIYFGKKNKFDRERMIYGITCQSCHGPAQEHVTFHQKNPKADTAGFILKYKDLSRQQKLDACARCHSGPRIKLREEFSYQVGDNLEEFSIPKYKPGQVEKLDVHANQYGLLTSSLCFINSPKMDCSTCHDVHAEESNQLAVFSSRCKNCHGSHERKCGKMTDQNESALTANCVDCHMPNFKTANILIVRPDSSDYLPLYMRTHRIGIYESDEEQIKTYVNSL